MNKLRTELNMRIIFVLLYLLIRFVAKFVFSKHMIGNVSLVYGEYFSRNIFIM